MANEKKMDYVILGLLSHEPLTGYAIKKRLDTTLKFFWGGSYGSIYPTLNMLEKQGLVIKNQTKENGRDKIIYTITDAGRDVLKEWLEKPVVKDELRFETLLKLFFGSEAGEEVALSHIDSFEEKIKKDLPYLQASVKQLDQFDEEEAHKYYKVTAMFGVQVYQAYLKWCEDVRKILNYKEEE